MVNIVCSLMVTLLCSDGVLVLYYQFQILIQCEQAEFGMIGASGRT